MWKAPATQAAAEGEDEDPWPLAASSPTPSQTAPEKALSPLLTAPLYLGLSSNICKMGGYSSCSLWSDRDTPPDVHPEAVISSFKVSLAAPEAVPFPTHPGRAVTGLGVAGTSGPGPGVTHDACSLEGCPTPPSSTAHALASSPSTPTAAPQATEGRSPLLTGWRPGRPGPRCQQVHIF